MCDTSARKQKACTRCHGTGFISTPVVHMGIPGLCMKCDGHCKLYWMTAQELKASKQVHLAAWLAEITEKGHMVKQQLTEKQSRLEARLAEGKKVSTYGVERLQEELGLLRDSYRNIRQELAELPAKKMKGNWASYRDMRLTENAAAKVSGNYS